MGHMGEETGSRTPHWFEREFIYFSPHELTNIAPRKLLKLLLRNTF